MSAPSHSPDRAREHATTGPRRGTRRRGSVGALVAAFVVIVAVAAVIWSGTPGDDTAAPPGDTDVEQPTDPAPPDDTGEADEPGDSGAPDTSTTPDLQLEPTPPPSDWATAWDAEDLDALLAFFVAATGPTDPDRLEQVEGQVTSQRDGEVIEDLAITWSTEGQPRPNSHPAIRVEHDDVTIRNVTIRAAGPSRGIEFAPGTSGGRVEHCEIDGTNASYGTDRADANYGNDGIVVQGGPVDVHRCHIHSVRVGLQAVPGSEVTENRIHALHQNASGTSTSSIQRHPESPVDEPSLIRANLAEAGSSGGITMYAENDAVRGSEVRDNLIVGVGRGFGIRGGRSHPEAGFYLDNRDIRIEGNRFTGDFGHPDVLGRGTNAGVDLDPAGNTFTDNRWWGSSEDVPARCGVSRDDCEGPNLGS